MAVTAPRISHKFICIADRTAHQLAAVISSYLCETDTYFPLFTMPGVTAPASPAGRAKLDEHTMSRERAHETAHFIDMAIAQLEDCEYIVLAGISADQESYLNIPSSLMVIRLDELNEVDAALSVFFAEPKGKLYCHPEELLKGLLVALHSQRWLEIRQDATTIEEEPVNAEDCVVIENEATACAVLAVNYAYSVRAAVFIVEPMAKKEDKEIRHLLEDWKTNTKDPAAFTELQDKIMTRVGTIDFTSYNSATFFTRGLPYSLVLGNPIPCCYVHLLWRPDFFVFNNIILAGKPGVGSGLVFSPQKFNDEEIDDVIRQFRSMQFYVKDLIGEKATAYNLSRSIEYFPYDILHICSHGGETHGTKFKKNITDSTGTVHTVVYDSVLYLAITPVLKNGQPMVSLYDMAFPRYHNGYKWHSQEWKAQNYPHSLFPELFKAMLTPDKTEEILEKDIIVPNSRSISCFDFKYNGNINILAINSNPVIFNNSCWSWGPISEQFLYYGAKGYIGTLWNIDNPEAVKCAQLFYEEISTTSVMNAMHRAGKLADGTHSENVYVFFGLPFTYLEQAEDLNESRAKVYKLLRVAFAKRMKEKVAAVRENDNDRLEKVQYILKWYDDEITTAFTEADLINFIQSILNARKKGK